MRTRVVVRLDARQEAELQRVVDNFVAYHKGDIMKALKEMIVLNGELQERLEKLEGSGDHFGRRRAYQ